MGNTDSCITIAGLSAGSYTIEATTYSPAMSGSFTLTVSGLGGTATSPGPGDTCGETITAADSPVTGTWADGCLSQVPDRGYARYYTFSLAQASAVTITLESDVDPFLFLWEGEERSGMPLYYNDDIESGGVNLNSQISQTLAPGTYTIEATTYHEDQTGSFTLTLGGL